jgi:hypothetical protein
MGIKTLIKEEVGLLLEKRIDQLVANLDINISLDVIKHGKGHANDRSKGKGREGIEGYDMRPVSNQEIKYFIGSFKKEIAEAITYSDVEDGDNFVISSDHLGLAIPLKANKITNLHWELIVMTVFRTSVSNPFRVGVDQLVIKK